MSDKQYAWVHEDEELSFRVPLKNLDLHKLTMSPFKDNKPKARSKTFECSVDLGDFESENEAPTPTHSERCRPTPSYETENCSTLAKVDSGDETEFNSLEEFGGRRTLNFEGDVNNCSLTMFSNSKPEETAKDFSFPLKVDTLGENSTSNTTPMAQVIPSRDSSTPNAALVEVEVLEMVKSKLFEGTFDAKLEATTEADMIPTNMTKMNKTTGPWNKYVAEYDDVHFEGEATDTTLAAGSGPTNDKSLNIGVVVLEKAPLTFDLLTEPKSIAVADLKAGNEQTCVNPVAGLVVPQESEEGLKALGEKLEIDPFGTSRTTEVNPAINIQAVVDKILEGDAVLTRREAIPQILGCAEADAEDLSTTGIEVSTATLPQRESLLNDMQSKVSENEDACDTIDVPASKDRAEWEQSYAKLEAELLSTDAIMEKENDALTAVLLEKEAVLEQLGTKILEYEDLRIQLEIMESQTIILQGQINAMVQEKDELVADKIVAVEECKAHTRTREVLAEVQMQHMQERMEHNRTREVLAQVQMLHLKQEEAIAEAGRELCARSEANEKLTNELAELRAANEALQTELYQKDVAHKKEIEAERAHLLKRYRERFEKGNMEYRSLKKNFDEREALMATVTKENENLKRAVAHASSERQKLKATAAEQAAATDRERLSRLEAERSLAECSQRVTSLQEELRDCRKRTHRAEEERALQMRTVADLTMEKHELEKQKRELEKRVKELVLNEKDLLNELMRREGV